jgi:hypothetical protein
MSCLAEGAAPHVARRFMTSTEIKPAAAAVAAVHDVSTGKRCVLQCMKATQLPQVVVLPQ